MDIANSMIVAFAVGAVIGAMAVWIAVVSPLKARKRERDAVDEYKRKRLTKNSPLPPSAQIRYELTDIINALSRKPYVAYTITDETGEVWTKTMHGDNNENETE